MHTAHDVSATPRASTGFSARASWPMHTRDTMHALGDGRPLSLLFPLKITTRHIEIPGILPTYMQPGRSVYDEK